MKKLHSIVAVFLLSTLFVLSGCMTVVLDTPKNVDKPLENRGAIFGYIDIPAEELGRLVGFQIYDFANLYKVKVYAGNTSDLKYIIVNNAFFAYNAAEGQFYIPGCTSSTLNPGVNFDLGLKGDYYLKLLPLQVGNVDFNEKSIKANLVSVKPGKLSFWGNAKVTLIEKVPFVGPKITVDRSLSTKEKEALEILLPYLKGSAWAVMAQARIDEIGK